MRMLRVKTVPQTPMPNRERVLATAENADDERRSSDDCGSDAANAVVSACDSKKEKRWNADGKSIDGIGWNAAAAAAHTRSSWERSETMAKQQQKASSRRSTWSPLSLDPQAGRAWDQAVTQGTVDVPWSRLQDDN